MEENKGDETETGSGGDDTMTGGAGDDTLLGGQGEDTLTGGEMLDAGGLAEDEAHTGEFETTDASGKMNIPEDVKEALKEEFPVLREHGSHDAAMKGLQTDASGSYSPPPHPR